MSRIALSDLGGAADLAGLATARAGRFRREIRLSLSTGGGAVAASVAPGTVLGVTFQSRDLNARVPGAPEAAALQAGPNGLVLSLPVARRIRSVRLSAPVAGDAVAAFRFDGQTVSDDPVAVATHGSLGAQLDVTDSALILRRRNGGDHALDASAIAEVTLRYPAANPTMALRPVDDPTELPFPTRLDAQGRPLFPATGQFGADLAEALGGLLARLPAPLPETLSVDLILAADQPCAARIDALELGLILQARALPEKTVLRFPGGRRVDQRLALALPPRAVLQGGILTVSVAGAAPKVPAETSPPTPQPGAEAIALAPGLIAATRLELAEATLVSGADCVVAAPDGPVRLRASLRADSSGLPGAILSSGDEQTLGSARPATLALDLPATALPAGEVWLALEAVGGRAVALLGGSGATATGDGRIFSLHPAARDTSLAAVLRSTGPPDAAVGRLEASLGPLRVALPEKGQTQIDLAAALPALSGSSAQLTVSSLVRAIVTVDAPLLFYTL